MTGSDTAENRLLPFTVVLDWSRSDYGAYPAPVVHVMAESRLDAEARAREAAWSQWADQVQEIPSGAAFDEAVADDLWYCVTVLLGHAPEAEGWADSGLSDAHREGERGSGGR